MDEKVHERHDGEDEGPCGGQLGQRGQRELLDGLEVHTDQQRLQLDGQHDNSDRKSVWNVS